MIPRIDLTSGEKEFPVRIKRRQFPIKLCFAMTIHKSQDQTFDRVRTLLESELFTHGQLYVGMSRVSHESGLY